jgi:hypothetical protein
MHEYLYKHLINPHGIRLLLLAPGEFTEPLLAKIVHVSIAEEREYSALSYAWQGDEKNYILSTHEGDIPIT